MRRSQLLFSLVVALALVPAAYSQDTARHMVALTTSTSGSETSLAVSPTQVDHGTPVTLKADVQPTQGGPEPTGTVSFYIGGYLVGCAPVSGTTAQVTISTRNIPTGTYAVYAVYSGDKNYKSSTSSDNYFSVLCDSNSTSDMAASPSWIYPGTPVTLSTDVSPNQGGPIPTGTVLFFEGKDCAHYLGSAPLIAGVATLTVATSGLPQGTYQVTSYYTGDSIYLPSTSETDYVWVQ